MPLIPSVICSAQQQSGRYPRKPPWRPFAVSFFLWIHPTRGGNDGYDGSGGLPGVLCESHLVGRIRRPVYLRKSRIERSHSPERGPAWGLEVAGACGGRRQTNVFVSIAGGAEASSALSRSFLSLCQELCTGKRGRCCLNWTYCARRLRSVAIYRRLNAVGQSAFAYRAESSSDL
jgi:hypothetical protein